MIISRHEEVRRAINDERSYQDSKWEGRYHEVGAYILFMEEHLARARARLTSADSDLEALHAIRKVTALGVACMEEHGAPQRGDPLREVASERK